MKTKVELLKQLEVAYKEFVKNEYEVDEDKCFTGDETLVSIAYTDSVFDYEDKYEYCIQCYLDLKNKKDIYEMSNEYICITFEIDSSYEDMIMNLGASFEDWVASKNGFHYDVVSKMIDEHLNGKDFSSEIEAWKNEGITVQF